MDESQFKALMALSRDSTLSQRDLSRKIGLSLGRVNFIVNSLIKAGYIKARRFKNSRNKIGYMYLLTPEGMKKKARIASQFLTSKSREYERLRREIEDLKAEIENSLEGAARE